jgi:hypothetical protein
MVQLVAASVSDSGRTIQNLLLELATAAEGLHRRLRPDARQMTVEEVDAAVEAIEVTEMGQNAKQILVNALNVFMAELSYPKRLVDLADIARQIVPDVTGRTNRWKARVANARVGFAHPMSEYFVLSRSLRWLLTAVLLLESGIDVAILASSFNVFDPYQQFLRLAKDQLPFVYDQVGTAASAPARRLADDGSAERRSASDVPTGTTPSEAAPPAVVAQSSRSTPTEDDVSKPSGATATDESDRSDDPPAAAAPPESAF